MRRFTLVGAALIVAFLAAGTAARADILISINKLSQRMTVTVDGVRQYTWPVSTGKMGYSTPSGSYRPFRMEKTYFSKEWDDAPMPNAIFFTGRGHAIHGTYQTRWLGSAVSHGCVRLAPGNAARLYAMVQSEGMGNTRVVITGGPSFDGIGSLFSDSPGNGQGFGSLFGDPGKPGKPGKGKKVFRKLSSDFHDLGDWLDGKPHKRR